MEIKTLAEILAESNVDSASCVSPAKKAAPSNSRAIAALSSSGDHDHLEQQAVNQDQANHQRRSQNRNTQQRQANKRRKPSTHSPASRQPTTASDLSATSQPNPAVEANTASSASSESSKRHHQQRRRQSNRFHPAANYTPKDRHGKPISQEAMRSIRAAATASTPAEASTAGNDKASEPRHSAGDHDISIQSLLAEVRQRPIKNISAKLPLLAKASDLLPNSQQTFTLLTPENEPSGGDEDGLPAALKAYLLTPEQRHANKEAIKAESRLRWLAFYYLSRREYGRDELRQKLLDKQQEPDKIAALLEEFAEKGYQSDERTALMLIREGIRKGRGRQRIKQEFYRRKLPIPDNIDNLIANAQQQSQEFAEFIDEDAALETPSDTVDWLKLAVEARVKKYGSALPTSPKDKAKQLRFLQYRGFKSDVCFAALKYNLQNLHDRH